MPLDRHLSEEGGIAHQACPAVDPQGVVPPGDEVDQPDVRVGHDVAEAIGTAVAGSLGDGDGRVVEDEGEPWRIALG